MEIKTGNFKQRANWFLVGFVFGSIFVITILLYIMQKADAIGDNLSSTGDSSYFLE